MKKILFLILPVVLLAACEKEYIVGKNVTCVGLEDSSQEKVFCKDSKDKPVDGTVIQLNENGKKIREMQMKGGYENGIEKEYYESGNLKVEANIVDGHPVGLGKIYYENGQLQMVLNFDGEDIQIVEVYDESGTSIKLLEK